MVSTRVNQSPSAVDETTLTTPILPEEALERLARFETPRTPAFYKDGIVDAGNGEYMVARLDDKRVLLFALNLEDLQLKEYPGLGLRFAHSGPFYPVKIYEESATTTEIYADLMQHQVEWQRCMREQYTLVRTAPDVYRSHAISYALRHPAPQEGHGQAQGEEEVVIDASIDSLNHHGELAPAAIETDGPLSDRMRVSHIPVGDGPVKREKAVLTMLGHLTGHLNKLARGEEGLDGEDIKLGTGARVTLRSKMYGVRLLDRLGDWLRQQGHELTKHPTGFIDIAERVGAFFDLLTPEGGVLKFLDSLWTAFGFQREKAEDKTQEGLRPYVSHHKLPPQFDPYLRPLDSAVVERLIPITDMKEAGIAPENEPILPGSPFDVAKDRAPDIGALRAPLGTILQAYTHTTLLLQANGVWMAMNHATDTLVVGYNKDTDTASAPHPAPILSAWLDNEKVICYTHAEDGHSRKAISMEFRKAAVHLQEIIASGDGYLLATHQPQHDPGPHIIPSRTPVEMRYLDFRGAFESYNIKMGAPPAKEPAAEPVHEASEKPHRMRVKWKPHPHYRPTHPSTAHPSHAGQRVASVA